MISVPVFEINCICICDNCLYKWKTKLKPNRCVNKISAEEVSVILSINSQANAMFYWSIQDQIRGLLI